jgi:hypothetical protein
MRSSVLARVQLLQRFLTLLNARSWATAPCPVEFPKLLVNHLVVIICCSEADLPAHCQFISSCHWLLCFDMYHINTSVRMTEIASFALYMNPVDIRREISLVARGTVLIVTFVT